jgi:hypothetical protein
MGAGPGGRQTRLWNDVVVWWASLPGFMDTAGSEPAQQLPPVAAEAVSQAGAAASPASTPAQAGMVAGAPLLSAHTQPWDPLDAEFCRAAPTPTAIRRLKGELAEISKESLPGIFVIPDESNILVVRLNCPNIVAPLFLVDCTASPLMPGPRASLWSRGNTIRLWIFLLFAALPRRLPFAPAPREADDNRPGLLSVVVCSWLPRSRHGGISPDKKCHYVSIDIMRVWQASWVLGFCARCEAVSQQRMSREAARVLPRV